MLTIDLLCVAFRHSPFPNVRTVFIANCVISKSRLKILHGPCQKGEAVLNTVRVLGLNGSQTNDDIRRYNVKYLQTDGLWTTHQCIGQLDKSVNVMNSVPEALYAY